MKYLGFPYLLYQVDPNTNFAVDVEYKITKEGQVVIKQVRPWAVYWADLPVSDSMIYYQSPSLSVGPNPTKDNLYINCKCGKSNILLYNSWGAMVLHTTVDFYLATGSLDLSQLPRGIYLLEIYSDNNQTRFSQKIIKI